MADHADPINAQQQGAAVFGMVEALFDPAQVVDQEGRAHLAAPAPGQFFLDHIQQDAAHRFQEFQQHVAGEAVTDHHVEIT